MKPSHGQATVLGLLLAVGAAFFAHRFVLGLELMGWDSYPLIAASRATGPAELLGSLSQELMGGRYPGGSFYRPVTNLFFALDHSLSGLNPFGYQRTNLLLHLAGVVAVFALARHWLGSRLGCVVAALVFAVHPLQLETVPVAARRADMLFTLFLVLALRAQPLADGASSLRPGLGALLVLLSAASKDTGAVALPMVAAALWWLPSQGDAATRTRRAARLVAPAATLFALFLVWRTLVLGGLGGHPNSSLGGGALAGLLSAPEFARSLLLPQPWVEIPIWDGLIWLGLLAGLALGLANSGRSAQPGLPATTPAPHRVALFAVFWLLCLLAMTGISGERASWYAVPFLPAYALLLGLVVDAGIDALRSSDAEPKRRLAAAVAGLTALILLGSHLRFSPLFRAYPEWEQLSAQEGAFLETFTQTVRDAPAGSTVTVPALPLGTGTPLERVGVRSALCLSDYSAAAFAELALPEHQVRVHLHRSGPATPSTAGVVTVDAIPLPSPVLQGPAGAG